MKLLRSAVGVFLLAMSGSAIADDRLRIVDLIGQFDSFAMATAALPDPQRVAAFERQIGPIANGFYSRQRRRDGYDLRILAELKAYPERRAATMAARRSFIQQFGPARQRFEAVFGPLPSRQPVFLLDSLGELDGGTRDLEGNPTLLFGADVIAEVHSGQRLNAFFYHELFHLYHEEKEGKCPAVWCALWTEGLATYVSSQLAPGASDDELVLNAPSPIRPAVEADRKRAVCAIVQRIESTSDEDFSALFLADDRLPGFPSRMGYYIGYLVAVDIGRTRGVHQMAALNMMDVRPLIDASLAGMATCATRTAEAREPSRTHRPGRLD